MSMSRDECGFFLEFQSRMRCSGWVVGPRPRRHCCPGFGFDLSSVGPAMGKIVGDGGLITTLRLTTVF